MKRTRKYVTLAVALAVLLAGVASAAPGGIKPLPFSNWTWNKGVNADSLFISLPNGTALSPGDADTTNWLDLMNYKLWDANLDSVAVLKALFSTSSSEVVGATTDTITVTIQYSPDKASILSKTTLWTSSSSRIVNIIGGQSTHSLWLGGGHADPALGCRYVRIILAEADTGRTDPYSKVYIYPLGTQYVP